VAVDWRARWLRVREKPDNYADLHVFKPLEAAPQHRLIAADDRFAECRLQVFDGFDLGRVGAAQKIAVGLVARIVEAYDAAAARKRERPE